MNLVHEPLFGITLGWFAIILIWVPLCFWILLVIGRRTRPGPFKWALLAGTAVLMGAIPLGDDAYIQWHFNRLCRDAGLHYERKIKVEGYLDEVSGLFEEIGPVSNPQSIESFERSGFRYYESRSREHPDKYVHIEKSDGQWQVSLINRPASRYQFKFLHEHGRIGFRLGTRQTVVVDLHTGHVVGRSASYTRGPGWLDGLWLGYFDDQGRQCPKVPGREYGYLPHAVLAPLKQP